MANYKIDEDLDINQIVACDVIESRKTKLKDFLKLPGVECISLSPLDGEQLMDDYFNMRPPFEKQKPYEFKDAITISAIRNFQNACSEKICIVSDDSGFRKAFEGDPNFQCFEYLGYFFKHIQEETTLDGYYIKLVDEDYFEEEILEYIDCLEIDRGDYSEWECASKEILGTSIDLTYIERAKEPNHLLLHVHIEFDVSVEITHRDEEQSFYDKEDGRYLFEEFVTWDEKHACCEDLIILCKIINDGEDFEFKEILTDKNFNYLDINDETMYDYDEISTTQNEDPDLIYCSQCKKAIGIEAPYFDYEYNPLCNDCMVDDSHGMVCPSCGLKYPFEQTMDGFCVNCYSDD